MTTEVNLDELVRELERGALGRIEQALAAAAIDSLRAENEGLRKHLDKRAMGRDPLADSLRARVAELENNVRCLSGDRDALCAQRSELEAQLSAAQPKADALDRLEKWLREDEFNRTTYMQGYRLVVLHKNISDEEGTQGDGSTLAAAITSALDEAGR